MHVPMGISQIIYELYPILLFTFGEFNTDYFEVNEDGTIIKGKEGMTCNGFLIYADLGQYNDAGLNKGVHTWSIRNLIESSTGCHLSIGVTTEKNYKLINEWKHDYNEIDLFFADVPVQPSWINEGYNSYWDGYVNKWSQDQVITIKLNCDDWNVTYYKDNKEIKKDKIEPDKHYHFALLCCCRNCNTHLKIEENPIFS